MKKIGFIGVGIMGKPMIRNLLKAGFDVNIFARDMTKVLDVISEGAAYFGSIGDCVRECEVVITIVGFPKDVEQIYFSRGNILDSAQKGAYLIDMTTTSPTLAEKISKEGTKRGFHVMDAPVTSASPGARDGTLSILVGGEPADVEACMSVFRALGTKTSYMGKAGSGQHAMLAGQIMIAGALSGICEGLMYSRAKGLNSQTLINAFATGAARSRQLELLGPKILADDYTAGFYMKHFIKGMELAADEARQSYLELDVLNLALEHCKMLETDEAANGEQVGNMGSQALFKFYEKRAEVSSHSENQEQSQNGKA